MHLKKCNFYFFPFSVSWLPEPSDPKMMPCLHNSWQVSVLAILAINFPIFFLCKWSCLRFPPIQICWYNLAFALNLIFAKLGNCREAWFAVALPVHHCQRVTRCWRSLKPSQWKLSWRKHPNMRRVGHCAFSWHWCTSLICDYVAVLNIAQ